MLAVLADLLPQHLTTSRWGSLLLWNLGIYAIGFLLSKLFHDAKHPRQHRTIKNLAEFLAVIHLPIASYCIALIRTTKLDEDTKQWEYSPIVLAVIFATVAVYQSLRLNDAILEDHNRDHDHEKEPLKDCPKGCKKLLHFNGVWTRILLLGSFLLVSSGAVWILTAQAIKSSFAQ